MIRIRVRRVGDRGEPLPLPTPATEGSAGLGLRADVDLRLAPAQRALVPPGVAIELPPGYEARVRPRSGWALRHGIGMGNAPGSVDSDYRGEIGVILVNLGQEPFESRRGDRIAQLVVARYERVELVE